MYMKAHWKQVAIERIDALIDRLESEDDIENNMSLIVLDGTCPVCEWAEYHYLISPDTPENNCSNEDGDLCPALDSCSNFCDIRNDLDITIKDRLIKLQVLRHELLNYK